MDWNTLLGVVIGGLIATIGSIINNRFQAREKDKDREEVHREAKTQLALKLMEKDIEVVENSINNMLKALRVIGFIVIRKLNGELSEDGMREEIISADGKFMQLGEESSIANKIATTFGERFCLEYNNFNDLCHQYVTMHTNLKKGMPYSSNDSMQLMGTITESAAELHIMLREKLISVRE